MKAFSIILVVILRAATSSADDSCAKWFSDLAIKSGPKCFLNCASSKVDLGTMSCHDDCARLCNESASTDFTFQISNLYPGLTADECALASKYPKDAIHAFKAKTDAERICETRFGANRTNDASDACRHFLWSALMLRDLSPERAKQFLTAHENVPDQPREEFDIDNKNNELGFSIGEKLKKAKNLSESSAKVEFEKLMKTRKLVIIRENI